jgi:hypothetical protein
MPNGNPVVLPIHVYRTMSTFVNYTGSFLHALMKFKDIDKIKVAISEML